MDDEFSLIARLLGAYDAPVAAALRLGPGDDAALWQPAAGHALAITTDTLLAGRHLPASAPAEFVGFRALAMNLSDLAAMGAEPGPFVVALTLPAADVAWLEAFAHGLAALAAATRATLAGGNLTRGPLSVTITAMGEVLPAQALRRSGARAGDDVWVSGRIGLAGQGLAAALALTDWPAFDDELAADGALARYLLPRPRIALGRALRGLASACVDVSDGLLADLGHVCGASGVAAELDATALAAVTAGEPAAALRAGDDYELCFTAPPSQRARVAALVVDAGVPLARIGRIVAAPASPAAVVAIDGRAAPEAGGYRHF